ncbi:MAG: AAA family ATPase [Lachnospiraceae bacterium]|nr:AAA family ATPase [Lachnospiraceae bacterium]
MRRYFNTEGQCEADIHYMVRLDERLQRIKSLYVDRGKYFVINRGRQYGKTTTLRALAEYIRRDYAVFALDFQKLSDTNFRDEYTFAVSFIEQIAEVYASDSNLAQNIDNEIFEKFLAVKEDEKITLDKLFSGLSKLCKMSNNPVVLLIDEVDSASNNNVFINFLSILRGYYLDRKNKAIFHSVILAGVYDIKNLKLKIRPDSERQYNSPWNIAAKFNLDMSFSADQIAAMLQEYESDNHTGMNIGVVSQTIYDYTSGYPYLVSAICKILDEELPESTAFRNLADIWTQEGIAEAVKIILKDKAPLFDSMMRQIDIYRDLREILEDIIYRGKQISYSPDIKSIEIGMMFSFLKEENGHVVVANRIFEMRLLNMFIAEEAVKSEAYRYGERDKNQFIRNNKLDMELVLKKFVEHFTDIYGENDERFLEASGRKFFLLYLKPIINCTGNYYLEAQTRDARRTDIIVDYLGEQFIVELKIWHGNEYNERGEKQLTDYLDYYHKDKGYLLSFNFNQNKKTGVKELRIGNKIIIEAVV